MSLKKDDVVELIEKDDNGWWLVRMNGVEGWAPNNYLELVQQSAPAPPAVPPPPRRAPLPKVDNTPSAASATAKPASVFPGTVPSNGSAKLRKMAPSNSDANSRPPNPLASKAAPPVAAKPKPPVGAKPPVGKPTIPAASGAPPAPPPPPAP
jgi:myosin I